MSDTITITKKDAEAWDELEEALDDAETIATEKWRWGTREVHLVDFRGKRWLVDRTFHTTEGEQDVYGKRTLTEAKEIKRLVSEWVPAGAEVVGPATYDFVGHLERQRAFSERAFGPGSRPLRLAGVIDHIQKELREIEADPSDLEEWIDVVLLACDGAWRAGHEPAAIAAALEAKLAKNERRTWPDWRTAPADKAIEHDRSKDGPPAGTVTIEPNCTCAAGTLDLAMPWSGCPIHDPFIGRPRCPRRLAVNNGRCMLPEGHQGECDSWARTR